MVTARVTFTGGLYLTGRVGVWLNSVYEAVYIVNVQEGGCKKAKAMILSHFIHQVIIELFLTRSSGC